MAAHKPIDEQKLKESVIRHKGLLKNIAAEFGVSTYKITEQLNNLYLPPELNAIRATRMRER